MPAKYQVYKDSAGKFRFRLLDESNKIIVVSEAYERHAGCKEGVESVQKNCKSEIEDLTINGKTIDHPKYQVFKDKASKFRFHLTASNGQIIAASEGYETKEECMNRIEVVKNSCNAEIEDLTLTQEPKLKPTEVQSPTATAKVEKKELTQEKQTGTAAQLTLTQKTTPPSTPTAQEKLPLPDDRMVWSKAETAGQIKKLDNEISVAFKHWDNETDLGIAKEIEAELTSANDCFAKDQNLVDAQDHLINAKHKLNTLINKLDPQNRWQYIISIWGVIPMWTAAIALMSSFTILYYYSNSSIISVPIWASLVAVIGASVQIFVGVVKDYKDDNMITAYKRLWYVAVIPASFAFGFIAYLLIAAGLLNISQGQFVLNQALNQTITTITITQIGTNQTVTQTAAQSGTVANLAVPMIMCFLAGYATDWFMSLLGKITSTSK